jgi:hypothetical protein
MTDATKDVGTRTGLKIRMLNLNSADPHAYILLGLVAIFALPRFGRAVLAFLVI